MKIILKLKGIQYGSNIDFYGTSKILRTKNSSISIGNNCSFRSLATSNLIGVNRPCILSSIGENSRISIGNDCGFSGTVIGCYTEIKIGNKVRCGANTLITDGDWHNEDYRSGLPRPVMIDDGVWLGVNVTILKGLHIGENSLIAAGSVVTKDIPANVVAGGNPCKVIRSIE